MSVWASGVCVGVWCVCVSVWYVCVGIWCVCGRLVCAVCADPRWGRGQETYGEDPLLVSTITGTVIANLQNGEVGTDPASRTVAPPPARSSCCSALSGLPACLRACVCVCGGGGGFGQRLPMKCRGHKHGGFCCVRCSRHSPCFEP